MIIGTLYNGGNCIYDLHSRARYSMQYKLAGFCTKLQIINNLRAYNLRPFWLVWVCLVRFQPQALAYLYAFLCVP